MTKIRARRRIEIPRWNPCGQCVDSWIIDTYTGNGTARARRCICWLNWRSSVQQILDGAKGSR